MNCIILTVVVFGEACPKSFAFLTPRNLCSFYICVTPQCMSCKKRKKNMFDSEQNVEYGVLYSFPLLITFGHIMDSSFSQFLATLHKNLETNDTSFERS